MATIPLQGQTRRLDGFHGTDGIALDTGDLHQTTDGVAGQAQVLDFLDLRTS